MKKIKLNKYLTGTSFSEQVLKAALSVPRGRVTTYGRIAKAAGGPPILAQSITNILSKAWNKGEHNIPFHRIVYSDGRIWTSPERHKDRLKKYKQEGIEVDENNKIKNFRSILFEFE